MPRYYGGYGQNADPREMAQLSGNPFYNPMQPGPDWYGGIMSLYANLKGAKQEKELKAQQEADRAWAKMMEEKRFGLEERKVTRAEQETETPAQRYQREMEKITKEHYFRMKEIEAQITAQARRAAEAQTKSDEDETYREKVRLANLNKKDRDEKKKTYNNILAQISAVEKRIATLEIQRQSTLTKGDAATAQAMKAEQLKLGTDLESLQAMKQTYLDEIIAPSQGPDYSKRLPFNLPGAGVEQKKFSFLPGWNVVPEEAPAEKEQTKIIDGVQLWRWKDGKWRDSKESTPTKK